MILESKKFYICDQQQLEASSQLGNLYSTNYPDTPSSKSEACSLQIRSENGVVRLEIVDLHLETRFDKVLFYDGADEQAKLLGNSATDGGIVISSGQYLFIKYTTDVLTSESRFHFRFNSGKFIITLNLNSDHSFNRISKIYNKPP